MFNKTLFLALFLALLAFPNSPVRAQVASEPVSQAQIQELQNTLVTLLTQLIAQLQAQITELIAQQAVQTTQLGAVEAKVETVVSQTAPVVVAPPPAPTVDFGTPFCRETKSSDGSTLIDNWPTEKSVHLPVTISGEWNRGTIGYLPANPRPATKYPTFDITEDAYRRVGLDWFTLENNAGTTTISMGLDGNKYTFVKTIFVGNVCQ